MSGQVTLCCLLWAHPGRRADLTAYENRVLALVADHRGEVLRRAVSGTGDMDLGFGAEDPPDEVQFVRFSDREALDAFLADPRRRALTGDRNEAIARTELFTVDLI